LQKITNESLLPGLCPLIGTSTNRKTKHTESQTAEHIAQHTVKRKSNLTISKHTVTKTEIAYRLARVYMTGRAFPEDM
jgi:hypothetical protein